MSKNSSTRTIQLSFDKLDLSSDTMRALDKAGYEKPSPIQASLIPLAMEDLDVIGQARTGTGKTAAFAIPVLERLDLHSKPHTQVLILVPTRELALQVAGEVQKLAFYSEAKVAAVYGGKPFQAQATLLKQGAHVIVGTPGRVIDHMKRGTLDKSKIWSVILDEADRMLDIGFRPDIEWILRQLPEDRQTLLLSATLPDSIIEIAQQHMYSPKLINLSTGNLAGETIEQRYFTTTEENKYPLLLKLLERENPTQAIIFCRTKLRTMRLHRQLSKKLKMVESIQGNLAQGARDRVMKEFRSGKVRFLVATDVMGRGIDVSNISHIINYDLPSLSDDYVHRVGRTGRMGREGIAFSFVTTDEGHTLTEIEKLINTMLQRDTFLSPEEEAEILKTKQAKVAEKKTDTRKKYRRSLSQ